MMKEIDQEVFLNVGQTLINDPNGILINSEDNDKNKKSYEEYRAEYLTKLFQQLDNLKLRKEKKIVEYNLALENHKMSIEKITHLNKKLTLTKMNNFSSSAINIISANTKAIKRQVSEMIELNVDNCKKMNDIQNDILFIDHCINKTIGYIELHSIN